MLPTCIGISGVSRYRNDASSEDSFLASAMGSSEDNDAAPWRRSCVQTVRAGRGRKSGLCIFRGRIGNGKGPGPVKMTEFALGLRQPVGYRPESRRVDAEANVACQMHLDILGGSRRPQQAGTPVNDPVGAG